MKQADQLFALLRGESKVVPDAGFCRDHGLLGLADRALGPKSPLHADALVEAFRIRTLHDEAAKIGGLFVKGVALGATVYDKPEHRPFEDLDLLVDDVKKVSRALEKLGYRPVPGDNPIETGFEKTVDGVRVPIDLHWAFTGPDGIQAPLKIPVAEILDRSVDAGRFRVPSLEDHLLLIAANLGRKFAERLVLVVDFARFAAQPLDWEIVMNRAATWKVKTPLWLGLELASRHLDARVPPGVMKRLAPGRLQRAALLQLISGQNLGRGSHDDPRYRFVFKALCLDSLTDTLTAAKAVARRVIGGKPGSRKP